MSLSKKILAGILALFTLMNLAQGIQTLVATESMLEQIQLAFNPDTTTLAAFAANFDILLALLMALSIFWIVKGKQEGVDLALLLGGARILAGCIIYLKLSRSNFAVGDVVTGLMVLIPSIIARRPKIKEVV